MHAGAAAKDEVAASARTPRALPLRFGGELALEIAVLALLPSLAAAIRARDWLPLHLEGSWWKPLVMFGLGNAICGVPLLLGAFFALRSNSRRQWIALRVAAIAILAPLAWFTWIDFESAESLQWAALGFPYLWTGSAVVVVVALAVERLRRARVSSKA